MESLKFPTLHQQAGDQSAIMQLSNLGLLVCLYQAVTLGAGTLGSFSTAEALLAQQISHLPRFGTVVRWQLGHTWEGV